MSPTNREKRKVLGSRPGKLAEFQFLFVRVRISRIRDASLEYVNNQAVHTKVEESVRVCILSPRANATSESMF